MEQRMYMTTGELAKLMGITKETLFHYDEIGLFRPAVVMDTAIMRLARWNCWMPFFL